jgi:hypothetical protein
MACVTFVLHFDIESPKPSKRAKSVGALDNSRSKSSTKRSVLQLVYYNVTAYNISVK